MGTTETVIWQSPVLIFQKKINQLTLSLPIQRSKDTSTIESMNKIINLMKDITTLGKEHHIENHLYYGGTINKHYNLLGDASLTKWLGHISKETLTPEETWSKLCSFLEDELRVQHVDGRASNEDIKPESKRNNNQDSSKNNRTQKYGFPSHSSLPQSEPICFICDAKDGNDDHISTFGPRGTRILKYYTCKKFVELSLADRLSLLKSKGYCFQCLFPGADATSYSNTGRGDVNETTSAKTDVSYQEACPRL